MGTELLERNADALVKEIGIPPCPAILTKLLREARADEPDFRIIGRLISGDVGLAAAVLKVANSPFYGLRTKAASVNQALNLLGLNAVTQLVTGLLLRQAFVGTTHDSMERYWRMSMAVALICALVCRECGKGDNGVAYTFGLFRDCGMPVMLQKYPIYEDIFTGEALIPGDPVLEVENERYGTNHAAVGTQLARSWYLPDTLCHAILHHHDVLCSDDVLAQGEASVLGMIALGLAAEQLYALATGTQCLEWPLAGDWALFELDLPQARFDALATKVKASINHI